MSRAGEVTRRGVLAAAASTLAMAIPAQASVTGEADLAARLAQIFHDSDEDQLRLIPQSATLRGDLRYAGQFGDLITDRFQRDFQAYIRRDLMRIASIERERLTDVQQLEYDVFRYQTEFARASYATGAAQTNSQDYALDHLNGQQVTFPQFMAYGGGYPYATVADYETALQMHEGFATYLERAQRMMRRGIRRGNVHVRLVAERVIGELSEALTAGVDGSPMLTPVNHFPASVLPADRARLTAAFRASIGGRVLPALENLKLFFEREYLPHARRGVPGLCATPQGPALYAYLLELYTTTRMSADQIHGLGLAEVARITAEMEEVRGRVGFNGTVQEMLAHVKTAPAFRFPSRDAYLARFSEIAARVREVLPRYFNSVPAMALEIRPVPQEMEAATSGAYYMPGAPDAGRPGVFYVNTSNLPGRTSPIMTALYLHEAIPGHHFQGALALENTSLPPFLRFLWNSGYVEGWGLYCERLGVELGMYNDPWQYLGMLDMQMFRAARLVIDTGLHARGWSRDQAIAYMADRTAMDRGVIELEIDRYIVTPGQAVSYKVGEQVILNLRAEAQRALGARFDIRAFHDQVLSTGSLPLPVLERKIRAWIARQRA